MNEEEVLQEKLDRGILRKVYKILSEHKISREKLNVIVKDSAKWFNLRIKDYHCNGVRIKNEPPFDEIWCTRTVVDGCSVGQISIRLPNEKYLTYNYESNV